MGVVIELQLIAEFTTRHHRHVLFAHQHIGTEHKQVTGHGLDVVVGMQVVDVGEIFLHKLQESGIVIDKGHRILLGGQVGTVGTYL